MDWWIEKAEKWYNDWEYRKENGLVNRESRKML